MADGAASTYLDSLFQGTAFASGVKVGTSAYTNYDGTITVTYNSTTKAFDVGVNSASAVTFDAVNAALATADVAIGVNGVIVQSIGAVELVHGTILADAAVTTTDATPISVMSVSLPSGTMCTIRIGVGAVSGVNFYASDKIGRYANVAGVLTAKTALTNDVISGIDDIGMGGGGLSLNLSGSNMQIVWTGKAATSIAATVWMQVTTY